MTTARTPRERKPKRPDVEVPALGFVGMLRWAWRQLTKMSTALVLLLTIPVLYAGDSIIEAFTLITSVASTLFIFVWTMILISYISFRRKFPQRHAASEYKMPGGVPMCFVVMAFFAFVVWALSTDSETAAGLVAVPVWLAVLWVSWFFVRRTESHQQAFEWFKQEVSEPETAAPSDS